MAHNTAKSLKYLNLFLIISMLLLSAGCRAGGLAPAPGTGAPGGSFSTSPPSLPPAQPASFLEVAVDTGLSLEDFSPSGSLVLHFSEEVDPDSSRMPVFTVPFIQGESAWGDGNRTLTFTPARPLLPGNSYTFYLDPGLRSSAGKGLSNEQDWTVRVTPGPVVSGLDPEAGQLATRLQEIRVSFDRPMDRSRTESALTIQPEVAYSTGWENDRSLVVRLKRPAQPGTRLTLTIAGGGRDHPAADRDGVPMETDFRWSYRLAPVAVDLNVPNLFTIEANFNYPLDVDRSGLPFDLQPAIPGTWRWVNPQQARFDAAAPMSAGRRFSLVWSGPLYDPSGEVVAFDEQLSFSTPPPIGYVLPRPDDNEVSVVFSPFVVSFTVPVDRASAEESFRITPALPGKFSWSADQKVMQFHPARILPGNEAYSLTLSTGIRDLAGQPLLIEPYTWSFKTTWSPYMPVSFGEWGANIQVMDAAGPRQVEFSLRQEDGKSVGFDLYRYELMDFARLYSEYYGMLYGTSLFDLPSGSSPATSWEYTGAREGVAVTTLPSGIEPGLYVLALKRDGVEIDNLFLVLTHNTLVVKQSGNELFVWLSSITGENLPDTEIRLYSSRGEKIRVGKTDGSGMYRTSIPAGYEPLFVAARSTSPDGEDVAIAGMEYGWRTNLPGRQWWASGTDHVRSAPYQIYIFTDRPIYRPGQEVNFKLVTRKDSDTRYSLLPAGTPVTIHIRDPRGNQVQSMEVVTGAFGTASGAFQVSPGAMLGNYSLEAVIDGVSSSQMFKVQEYRKPDFALEITPAGDQVGRVIAGEEFDLDVAARYFYGEPLSGVKLSARIYEVYPWLDNQDNPHFGWGIGSGVTVSPPETVTGPDGTARLTASVDTWDKNDGYRNYEGSLREKLYVLEVTADDGSNQTVASSYRFTVYNSSEKVSLDVGSYLKKSNTPFTVKATSEDLDGRPIPDSRLSLLVNQWDSNQKQYSAEGLTFELNTGADGTGSQELSLMPGYYQLTLSRVDTRGNTITHRRWLYVYQLSDSWTVRYSNEVTITADKDRYKPYETARFLIESPFSGPALLTFERGRVIHSKFIQLTAPLTEIETQIIPEDGPNVFVVVNAWQPGAAPDEESRQQGYYLSRSDSYLRLARAEIRVDISQKALQVELIPEETVLSPRLPANITVEVRDWQGRPVEAEVSLAVVDEAIFSLSADLSGDIFSAFYNPRYHGVTTFDSMSPYRLLLPGGFGGGGGDDAGPSGPRGEFRDTAAWFPSLVTDEDGRVQVTLQLPDNLTAWRLTAKAVTRNHQVGQASETITARKDLVVLPFLPGSLVTGDRSVISARVSNHADRDRTVQVSLDATGLAIAGDATRTVVVKAGQSLNVDWLVLVEAAQPVDVTVSASSPDGGNDSVRLQLPVRPMTVSDIRLQSGDFIGSATLGVILPVSVTVDSEVTLNLSRVPIQGVLEGLEYLTGFPYGCVEQTLSKALPNAVVLRAAQNPALADLDLQTRVKTLVTAGIQRLYGLQLEDGGWGWWFDDRSNPYLTSWVLYGLAQMQATGEEVAPSVLENGARYLEANLDNIGSGLRAFALYSLGLSGYGNPQAARQLAVDPAVSLDPFSLAALALTLHRQGDTILAQEILMDLEAGAVLKGEAVYWPENSTGQERKGSLGSPVKTTSLALSAYLQIQPDSPLIPGMVKYLLSQREGSGWSDTHDTAFAVLAITEFLSRLDLLAGSQPYQVKVDGKHVAAGELQAGNSYLRLDLPLEKFRPGLNTLTIVTSPQARLYYDLRARYELERKQIGPGGSISISRRYLDPITGAPVQVIKQGMLVRVELTIQSGDSASYVLVEDSLPGGLVALNEALNTTSFDADLSGYGQVFYWQEYGYNYKQVHTDRVAFFITELNAGTKTLTYLVRAAHEGIFTAPPARVSAMYDQRMWGRSASQPVLIEAR